MSPHALSRAVRKKEARIRGAEMMDLPALRVYWAKHRSLGRPTPDVDWEDLDVLIAALDALEEGIESARRHMYALNKAVADERDKTRSLQARIDAATELIRNMIAQDDRVHEVWDGLDEGPCPVTAPFRAWLSQGGPR